jgi:iron complex outermembrane receptor protein
LELTSSVLSAGNVVRDPNDELSLGGAEIASRGDRVTHGARLELEINPDTSVVASLGQELERLAIDAPGVRRLNATRDVTRVAASARHWIAPWLEVGAIAALACHATDSVADRGGCAELVPEGRVTARGLLTPELELLANAGRYVRVPTLGELYGVAPLVRGNSELTSETAYAVDAGLRASARAAASLEAFVELFGFARLARDLITYRRAALGYARPYNTQASRTLGAELVSGVDVLEHVHAVGVTAGPA